jgi:hypothetical protein
MIPVQLEVGNETGGAGSVDHGPPAKYRWLALNAEIAADAEVLDDRVRLFCRGQSVVGMRPCR